MMKYLAVLHLQAFTHSTELKKLSAGFLVKEMLDRFRNKSLALLKPDRSLWIYAAHDLTIVNILNALNLFDVIIIIHIIMWLYLNFSSKSILFHFAVRCTNVLIKFAF